jgi:DNA polymerase-3 subunit alpha
MSGSNITTDKWIRKAKDLGFSVLALSDKKMHGVIDFYSKCIKANIKPIIGLSIPLESVVNESKNDVLLFAKNMDGYRQLLQLSSIESSEGLVSLAQMKDLSSDIIAVYLSAESELYSYFSNNDKNKFIEVINGLNDTFSEYLVSVSYDEAFDQFFEDRKKLVYADPIRFLDKDDYVVYKTLRSIFGLSNDSLLDKEEEYYWKEKPNMLYKNALENVSMIADVCEVDISFDQVYLPKYRLDQDVTSKDYLYALAHKGLSKRLEKRRVNRKTYEDRLNYELRVIDEMGYNDYFLIVWDFVKYAKGKGYLVGPGRGSAAASLVSYCLGITTIDSIQYDLVFERFLNPERITLPDIDIDLPDDKRDDVIRYVRDFYGNEYVASICTFGTFQAKSAIRDVARVLEIDGVLLDEIVKKMEDKKSIEDVLSQNKDLQNIVKQKQEASDLITIASRVEGLNRHISTHAAGIIVGDSPLVNHTALQPGINGINQTQYEAKDLEKMGLLKIDFLGLRNLTSISKMIQMIEDKTGKRIPIYSVPMDDPKAIQLLHDVETVGVFQLESQGMKSLIGQMKMREFEDIVTVLALFRPGPMENIPSYIKRRHKEEQVTYPHAILKDVLEPTNGIIVYQEQIIKIASLFAGYSFGEADVLRRAVSKKLDDVLQEERKHFVEKARALGRDDAVSNEIYDYIVKFSNYGFNRAHSVAYAFVAYWMAYLKANYPSYFIAVLMSSVIGSEKNTRDYIFEAHKLNVEILKPDINLSASEYVAKDRSLLYPLLGIKNVGRKNVENLLQERKNGSFTSYVDFISRTKDFLNKRVLESLIKASALDVFGLSKRTMLEGLEDVVRFTQLGGFINSEEFVLQSLEEFDFERLQEMEQEVLGFNLVYSPINKYNEYIKKHGLLIPSTIKEDLIGKEVRIVAMLGYLRKINTKQGKEMAFVTLQDGFHQLDGVLFTSQYSQFKDLLQRGKVYLLKGKVDARNSNLQFIVNNVYKLDE